MPKPGTLTKAQIVDAVAEINGFTQKIGYGKEKTRKLIKK